MQLQPECLRRVLIHPGDLVCTSIAEWDLIIRQAKRTGLLARIHRLLSEHGLLTRIPTVVKPHLESARLVADNEERIMRWEVNRIQRALAGVDTPVILLKGAAYLLASLPNSRGRLSSDIDILVPKENLTLVEKALLAHGWEHVKLEEYDQYYYRRWSHELPPLRHRERGTIVDVHHAILPLTGRLQPDSRKLWERALPLDGTGFKILSPSDMVLHGAAHAFQDGDLRQGMRDLVDLDDLLRHFSAKTDFWNNLFQRAAELNLRRPLFYALRYCNRFLQTPLPASVVVKAQRWKPKWPARQLMDVLIALALLPEAPRTVAVGRRLARWLLYLRSHWLRMPPWLLAWHLVRKSWMRSSKEKRLQVKAA